MISIQPRLLSFFTFLILMIGSLIFGFLMMSHFLLSLAMGGMMAILVAPLQRSLTKRALNPTLSATLVVLGVLIGILGPLLFFIARAVQQGIAIGQHLTEGRTYSLDSAMTLLNQWEITRILVGDASQMEAKVRQFIGSGLGFVSTGVFNQLTNLPDFLLQLFIILLVCFYLLIDGHRLIHWFGQRIPLEPSVRHRLGQSIHETSVSVVWANFAAALSHAVIITIGFFVLDIPGVFLAAGLTFIFAWIPVVGSTPVWISGAIYLFVEGAYGKGIAMVFIGLFTSVADNIVRPYVLRGRGRDQSHPAISLLAIFGGIEMFGFLGVFIGPVIAAFLVSILELWPAVARRSGLSLQRGELINEVEPEVDSAPKQSPK